MVKVAAFVIVIFFLFCAIFAGMQFGGYDVKFYMPNIYKTLIDNIPNGLSTIKQAFIENPFSEVYELFLSENLSFWEALGLTIPTFASGSVDFVKGIFGGFRMIFFDPFKNLIPITVDRSPYI